MFNEWRGTFEICPQSKQSCAFAKRKGYTPKEKKAYVETLRVLAMVNRPDRRFRGPVRMSVEFHFLKKSQTLISYRIDDPDLDNMLKPLKDSLAGVVYENDNQVVSIEAKKFDGPWEGIKVIVETLALED
jgi:Holliday junction resolvase RusA-like endonuclease